ncbi:MAG: TetR/AcrR family transcriptional regulator [Acidobacteriota bacterium]
MRYPADHKAQTRAKILKAAGRVFRRQGYQGGGVDAVMREAGLTHGGFYAHFRNKEALFGDAVLAALYAMREQHDRWTEGQRGADWVRAFVSGYLDRRHVENAESGCPVPTLVSELGRAGDGPKREFEKGLDEWAGQISSHLGGTSSHAPDGAPDDRSDVDAAFGVIAASIGAVALARAVADDALSDHILASTRTLIEQAVDAAPASDEET